MKKREDRLLIASLRYFLKINDLKDVPYENDLEIIKQSIPKNDERILCTHSRYWL